MHVDYQISDRMDQILKLFVSMLVLVTIALGQGIATVLLLVLCIFPLDTNCPDFQFYNFTTGQCSEREDINIFTSLSISLFFL